MCIRDRDNTAQALGVQTESTVEAVKKASTTKELSLIHIFAGLLRI